VVTEDTTSRRRALLALALLAPAPSLGIWAAMMAAPGPVGHGVFLIAKLWLLVFPAAWYLLVEKGKPSWSLPRRGGIAAGVLSGVILAAAIVLGAWLIDVQHMDLAPLRAAAREMNLASPAAYLAGAAAWTLVNSLIEEYVYRWFVLRQCEVLLPPAAAVIASAAIFTIHHVIALNQYLEPGFTALASAGVFVGGVVWATLYHRYRSIWPGWISHVLADIAVFGLGGWLLFG
jgi:membrane protease YdiL (CAAX protease family)